VYLVGDAQILDGIAANVALGQRPELLSILWPSSSTPNTESIANLGRQNHISQVDVHVFVAARQVSVVRLAVLQLNHLRR
jgi:hypothetical protein